MVTYPKHPPPLTAKITFFPQPTKPKPHRGKGTFSDKSDRSDKSDESDATASHHSQPPQPATTSSHPS